MIIAKVFKEYSVGFCEQQDYDAAIAILKKKVIGRSGTANSRYHALRVLEANARDALWGFRLVGLMKDNTLVGCAVLIEAKGNVLQYISVPGGVNAAWGSGTLMHFILNEVYKGQPVFMYDSTHSFTSIAELVDNNSFYRFKDSAAIVLGKMYG